MIHAVLEGKSLGYQYTEDILTSVAFGTLKYIQPSVLLIPFIESAFLYDQNKTTLWESLKKEGIELRCYQEVEYYFWVYHTEYGEPDLILLFSNHIHGLDDLLLVIEAKFKSNKSGVGEKDQLVRYLKAIESNNIEAFSEPKISSFKGKRGYIIYLTESIAYSEIKESRQNIDKDVNEKQVYHLMWQQLYETFERMYSYFSTKLEEAMANDLMDFMDNIGLRGFSGISLPNNSLVNEFSRSYPVFYDEKSTYFELASNLKFSFKDKIFFRG